MSRGLKAVKKGPVLIILKPLPQLLIPQHLSCAHHIHNLEEIRIADGIARKDQRPRQPREGPLEGIREGNVQPGDGGGDDFVVCLWDGPFNLGFVVGGDGRGHGWSTLLGLAMMLLWCALRECA